MLASFVAGAYTGTWNGTSIGLTKEGYRLRLQYGTDDIDSTDAYGKTLIEQFFLSTSVAIGGIFMEYKAGSVAPVTPWYPLVATGALDLGIISRAASAIGKTLVLTSTTGTPSAASPASLTAAVAIQAKGFNVEMLYGPTHREIPFLFTIIPVTTMDSGGGGAQFFTTTALLIASGLLTVLGFLSHLA